MKHPGKPKVVSSGDSWIADPYMSFSLCREEGWILRSSAGLGFKDWENLGSGRNSFQALGVQGLWDLKPEPLPLKLLCMKQATSAPSPNGAFQRHRSAKKRRLSRQNQHQRCTLALRGAGESDAPQQGVHNKQETLSPAHVPGTHVHIRWWSYTFTFPTHCSLHF